MSKAAVDKVVVTTFRLDRRQLERLARIEAEALAREADPRQEYRERRGLRRPSVG